MDNGKFSRPRDYRDEERQIEEAFRQITEQKHPPRQPRKPLREVASDSLSHTSASQETLFIPAEQLIPAEFLEDTDSAPQPEPEEPIEDSISRQIEKEYTQDLPPVPIQPEIYEEDPFLPEDDSGDFEEDGDSFLEKLLSLCRAHPKWIFAGLLSAALVMIVIFTLLFAFAGSRDIEEDRILNNVFIAGVNVGGMRKSEAINAVKNATANTYTHQDMVVSIAGNEIRLSPKDTKAALDVTAAVDAAYNYGRTGTDAEQKKAQSNALLGSHTIGLLPYLQLDKDYIRQTLTNFAGDTGSTLTQPSYGLEGTYPSLSTLGFDPTAAQTLVLTMGTPGVTFDTDTVYDQILDAYSLHTFLVRVEDVHSAEEPEDVDLQAIYDEFYVKPVDDRMNLSTFETIPGSYGYEFDLDAAQRLVDKAQYGEIIRIPMLFIEPKLLEDNVLFRDVMGEYQTSISGGQSRLANITLACQAFNGTVLQPGETFSFNAAVGEPTARKGYQESAVFSGGMQRNVMGGGISQAATTLYCAALISDLEIVSRSGHEVPVSFVDMGLDADAAWGGADLKLRNGSNYPIQIKASVSGSSVTVQILGTDNRDYLVKLEQEVTNVLEPKTDYQQFPYENSEGYLDGDVIREGITGYSVKTYKLKYSRSNGRLLSKDYEAGTQYTAVSKLVALVAPPETTVPETTVPEITVPPVIIVPPEPTLPPETTIPPETAAESVIPEPVPETTEINTHIQSQTASEEASLAA